MSTVSVTNLKHESASGNNITLDSSGRTILGGKLAVGSGVTPVTALHAQSSSSEADRSLRLAYDGTYYSEIRQLGAGGMAFRNNNTNDLLKIDGSGRVTMPYQPAFHAVSTSVKTITGSAFIFDSAYFNIGGHYNTSNGRFTAPVSGIYFLEMSFLTSNTNTNNVDLRFFKNGVQTQIATTYHVNYTGGNHRKGHMIGMASLTANDYITVQTQSSSSNGDLYGDNNEVGGKGHTCFRGYLIG